MLHNLFVVLFISIASAVGSLVEASRDSSGLQSIGCTSRADWSQGAGNANSAIVEHSSNAFSVISPGDSSKGDVYKTLTAEDLLSKIRAKTRYILIDCRPEEEFRAGHIPGAVNISMDSYTFGAQTVLKSSLEQIVGQVGREIDFVLIDGSSNEEYMPRSKLLELIRVLPEDRSREVILYCRKPECTRSPMAIRWALALGYKNLWRFLGGWKEWSEKKYPVGRP